MQRRTLLDWVGKLMAGAAMLPRSGRAAAGDAADRSPQVIVIGAGLAGLSAAQALRAAGVEVVVLEARTRIGGRVWTSTRWSDLPMDLGASWIHGETGNPITRLADTLQTPRVQTSYARAVTYGPQGTPLDAAGRAELAGWRQRLQQALRDAQDADEDVSLREVADTLLEDLDEAESASAARWLAFVLSSEYEQEYAGSAERLSAYWFDADEAYPGEDVVFAQGFGVIPQALAQGLRIDLGQVVREVHWQGPRVRVDTTTARYEADQVLVTLPLGVLQADAVRFVPALPAARRSAIRRLGMGVLNKCYLRFANAFWPTEVDWLERVSEPAGEWTEWVSFQRALAQPVLLGFNAADHGRALESRSDAQTVAAAMRCLRGIYGPRIPAPLDVQVTRWAQDPFARGAYSYNALGSHPDMRDELAAPVGRTLHFAGEATHREYFGTTHGAVLSGERAARDILQQI